MFGAAWFSRRAISIATLAALAACGVFGFFHEHLLAQELWSDLGRKRFLCYTAVFWLVAGPLAWLRPRWLPVAAAGFVLIYSVWWCGPVAILAALYLLASSFLLGRILAPLLDGLTATLLGLAAWVFIISLIVHFPINRPWVYSVALGIPFAIEFKRLPGYAAPLKNWKPFGRSTALVLAALLFVLLSNWFAALMPEVSSDGLAMHLTIPAAVARDGRWSFDFHHFAWAVMPMGGDWAHTAAYLLGGESAAHLIDFSLLAIIAAMIARSRQPIGVGLAAATLFVSTPLVRLVTGSLFVENFWAALVLGAALELVRYLETNATAHLLVAAALSGVALSTKLGALAFVAPAAAISAIALRRGHAKALAVAALLFALLAAPPYLNALWRTGNPVFPFYNAIFQSPAFDTQTSFTGVPARAPLTWHALYDLTFRTREFLSSPGAAGFQYFLLLIPAWILISRLTPLGIRVLLAAGTAAGILTVAFQHELRYLYPALALLSIVFGYVWPRWALLAIAAANVCFLPVADWYHRDFAAFTRADRDRYVEYFAPQRKLIDHLNRTAPGEATFFVHDDLLAGLNAPAFSDSWHTYEFLKQLQALRMPDQLNSLLRARAIHYIIAPPPRDIAYVVVRQYIERWTEPDTFCGQYTLRRILESPKPIPSEGSGAYEDYDPRIDYTGVWIHATGFPEATESSVSYSGDAGDFLRSRFAGSAITYVYTKAFNRGFAEVLIDGRSRAKLDLYSEKTLWKQQTAFGDLGPGEHILEIRVMGVKNPRATAYFVDLDQLIVAP